MQPGHPQGTHIIEMAAPRELSKLTEGEKRCHTLAEDDRLVLNGIRRKKEALEEIDRWPPNWQSWTSTAQKLLRSRHSKASWIRSLQQGPGLYDTVDSVFFRGRVSGVSS